MERDLFEIILFLSLQLKTDVKNWRAEFSLTSAVHLSFPHNGGLVQTTPKRSSLKDQETWVIDESPSGMDTLWIHYGCFIDVMYFVWLLTRKAWLANKVSFKKCMCCRQRLSHRFDIWLRRYHHLLKTFE